MLCIRIKILYVYMKKLILLFIHTFLFAALPNQGLMEYQNRYTLCKGKTNYQITKCLLNGNINYTSFRGDRFNYKKINKKELKEEEYYGDVYRYVMHLFQIQKGILGC